MSSCPACGVATSRGSMFCAQCGAGLGHDEFGSASGESTAAVIRSGSNRWAWMVGAVVALFFGWVLLRSPSGGEMAGVDEVPGEADAPTSTAPTSTAPSSTAPTPSSTDATRSGAVAEPDPGSGDVVWAGEGPLLGEPSGLSILLSHRGDLVALDLDTAVATIVNERWAGPVFAVADRHLLIGDRYGGSRSIVPLDDLGSDPIPYRVGNGSGNGADVFSEILGPDPDVGLWVIEYSDTGTPDYRRYQLSPAVRVIETLVSPPEAWAAETHLGIGALVNSTGGIFERTSNGFKRNGFGEVRVAMTDEVLTTECDERLRCASVWRDRESWSLVGRPVPDYLAESQFVEMFRSGTDIVIVYGENVAGVFDGRTGLRLPFPDGDQIDISPDGRWVLGVVNSQIMVWDRETSSSFELSRELTTTQVAVFVNTADLG